MRIRPLLIVRPLDGALQTERRAKDLGLQTVVDPLFTVESIKWSGPLAQDFDALLLTSTNAIKYGGAQLNAYRSLPVLAVGKKTARAAENAGFEIAKTGNSGGQQLLDELAADQCRRILWLAGEQHSVLDSGDRKLDIVPVYESRTNDLGARATACLQRETVIAMHSSRAARHLVSELDRLQIPRGRHHAVVFSGNVAEAAGQGWGSLHTADRPDDDSLLSLATRLCHSK